MSMFSHYVAIPLTGTHGHRNTCASKCFFGPLLQALSACGMTNVDQPGPGWSRKWCYGQSFSRQHHKYRFTQKYGSQLINKTWYRALRLRNRSYGIHGSFRTQAMPETLASDGSCAVVCGRAPCSSLYGIGGLEVKW